ITILKNHGIKDLYPPQKDAFPHVFKEKNVVMSVPTASGKSLVAYIAIINRLLKNGGKALYVVPLIALAKEKYEELKLFEEAGFRVGISTGDLDDSNPRLAKFDIIVCTSEKADSLLRHGVRWVEEIQVLVIDEIHLIHDPSRGPTLEVLIARFQTLNPQTQIIALSATIENATELSLWLHATLIQTNWRPVPLREGVSYQHQILFDDGKITDLKKKYPDELLSLVEQSLSGGGQVLVFVNARRSTVSVARKLGTIIDELLSSQEKDEINLLIEQMKKHPVEHTSVDTELLSIIQHGVAFHHAGLSSYHRKTIEESFKKGLIKCIVATPTLAAGVNIPAQRVIIRDLWRYEANYGMKPIPVLEYKQQAGRAGRPRYDTYGEAISIAKKENQKDQIFSHYIHGDNEPIYSKLGNQSALRMHLLAAIATRFVHTIDDIYSFIDSTFYAYQAETYTLKDDIDETLQFLSNNEFVTTDQDQYTATLFGNRTSSLYIDPLSALQLRKALENSEDKSYSEIGFLHAVCATPDVRSLYLRRSDSWVSEEIECIKDECLLDVPPAFSTDYEWFLGEMKTALLLSDWIDERSEDQLVSKYGVGPGDIHSLIQGTTWLLHATREFARMYNFKTVSFLTGLLMRVQYGCKKELLNLISLKGIGRVRARALFNAGFTGIGKLRVASTKEIAAVNTIGPRIAERIKNQVTDRPIEKDSQLTEYQRE
ncbi:DEAD/DEAH box helicase, partial [Pseudomonadota bacterium]